MKRFQIVPNPPKTQQTAILTEELIRSCLLIFIKTDSRLETTELHNHQGE